MQNQHHDCYFFDPELALQTARQQNRVQRTIAVSGLQICYLGSDQPVADAPPNLIQVPPRETIGFFTNTRMRLPTKMVLSPALPQNLVSRQGNSFRQMLRTVEQKRLELTRIYAEQLVKQKPLFTPGQPLRIFIPASRLTTVMQYSSRDLASAFRDLGHEVRFMIEENDMEEFEPTVVLHEQLRFNPHLVVNINHRANSRLHPEVFNLTWWQDPMPELRTGKPLMWRERDLVYSYTRDLDDLLAKTGATRIKRQGFCIDRNLFRPNPTANRESKVVFIGSGVLEAQISRLPEERLAFRSISRVIEEEGIISPARCQKIAEEHGIDPQFAYWKLYYFAIRRNTVRWLCQQTKIPVEIYGRYWDEDEVVRPFYRGEVPHGEKVAEIYNSARYAFVCHPFEIQSQRLVEAAACGAIPVVYDCRHIAGSPPWEDHCQFFSCPEGLETALIAAPQKQPEAIAELYDFKSFAHEICESIWKAVEEG